MQIINHKTGSVFTAYTVQDRAGFASCITMRQGNREVLIGREVYPTRSRAYKSAVKFCKTRAAREGVTA